MKGFILVVMTLLFPLGAAVAQGSATACVTCHSDADLFDEEGLRIAKDFAEDVHAEVGLSCQDCHGGNPDPTLADDMDSSMDPGFAEHPYVGAPEPALRRSREAHGFEAAIGVRLGAARADHASTLPRGLARGPAHRR